MALVRACAKIEALTGANDDQTVGVGIARRAMEAPLRQIVENAGEEGSVVVDKVRMAKVTLVTMLVLEIMVI